MADQPAIFKNQITPSALKNPSQRPRISPLLSLIALAVISVPYGMMWKLSRIRDFDPDEFEHLHAAWCVTKGMVPYRDFFEHHTPLFYYLMAPMIRVFHADLTPDRVVDFLFMSRSLMWLLTGVILFLIFRLGSRWRDRTTGIVAAALFMNTLLVVEKCLESRPDLPSTIAWLLCLDSALSAFHSTEDGRETEARKFLVWSGISWGTAVLFSQKLLMAGPGLFLTAVWYVLDRRMKGTILQKLFHSALFIFGAALPMFLTAAYYAHQGALRPFIEFNFLMNFGWVSHIPPYEHIQKFLGQNPFIITLALAGGILAIGQMFGKDGIRHGNFILVLNFIGLIAGIFILPVAQRQYFLTFLPIGVIFASAALLDTAVGLAERRRLHDYKEFVVVLITGAAFWLTVKHFAIPIKEQTLLAYLGAAVAITLTVLWFLRSPEIGVSLILVSISIHAAGQIKDAFQWKADETIKNVLFLHRNTSASDTIMEGWKGFGVFRPHAYFYYFLHEEIRAMLTESQYSALLNDLESGTMRPKYIVYDEHLRGMPPKFFRFFLNNYAPSERPLIWERKSSLEPMVSS